MALFFESESNVLMHVNSPSDWIDLLEICEGFLLNQAFEKIRNFLCDDVKSIVIEKGYFDADYRNTYNNFFAKKFAYYPSQTIRLNFFLKTIPEEGIWILDEFENEYLG